MTADSDGRGAPVLALRSLRVLLVHNRYRSGQPSGEDRVVDQEMAALARAGHHVEILERRSDDIASMPVPRRAAVPLQVVWNPAGRVDLRNRLRADRPDVVHIHNTFPLLSTSVVAACADVGVPAVATLHNYRLVCANGSFYRDGQVCTACTVRSAVPALRHGCYRDSRLATLPLVAGIAVGRRHWTSGIARFFCISDAQRQLLVRAGVAPERLVVKHNFVPEPRRRRTAPGRHVLYLGRMTEEKGLRDLMTAWDLLAATGGVEMPLLLAGTGPLEDEVRRWAGGREDVRFLGLRSADECGDLVAAAAVVVAPSAWMETFGLVVVEAMAAAVPSVVPAHGAFVELVRDGTSGLLHEPGDATSIADCLRRAVADPERNMNWGSAARHRYEADFTPDVGVAALVAGYRAAIAVTGSKKEGWSA